MILEHSGKKPEIDPSAFVAPTATVCGDVRIGEGSRIMHGASVIAEGGSIEIAGNCIILENAVVRSTAKYSAKIGNYCLIGPNAHVVGCTLEESVFIATGAAIFHGACLESGSEVRVHGVVHLRTRLLKNSVVPIGWIAVGDPAKILPPNEHEEIWKIQKDLNFPLSVYGVKRPPEGETNMPEICRRLSEIYGKHKENKNVG
jgi:carbonic anhydrase/acetyltransferase-like protein (isoleucine patch superfamily)